MHVVELEAQLADDASGELRDELCSALAKDRSVLRRTIDAGLPPDEFNMAQVVHDAFAAAERVVNDYWRQSHAGARIQLGN
jgi:hypothetical protein